MKLMICGFNDSENEILKDISQTLEVQLTLTDDYRDLLGIWSDFVAINTRDMSHEAIQSLQEAYNSNEDVDTKLFILDSWGEYNGSDSYQSMDMLVNQFHKHLLSNKKYRVQSNVLKKIMNKTHDYIVIDTEMTSIYADAELIKLDVLIPQVDEIRAGKSFYFKPEHYIRRSVQKLFAENMHHLLCQSSFRDQVVRVHQLLKEKVIVGYHIAMDVELLKKEFLRCGIIFEPEVIDISVVNKMIGIDEPESLFQLARRYRVDTMQHDIEIVHQVFGEQIGRLQWTESHGLGQDFFLTNTEHELSVFLEQDFGELFFIRVDDSIEYTELLLTMYCSDRSVRFLYYDIQEVDEELFSGRIRREETTDGKECYRALPQSYIQIGGDSFINTLICIDLQEKEISDAVAKAIHLSINPEMAYTKEDRPRCRMPSHYRCVIIYREYKQIRSLMEYAPMQLEERLLMDHRTFKNKAMDHAKTYYTKVFGDEYPSQRGYVLPSDQKELNILEPYRAIYSSSTYSEGIKYHQWFHNLLSSQAMCINFFLPLIIEKKMDLLLELFQINDHVDYGTIAFEKISVEETGRQKTNFDFYFETKGGRQFFFEVKYTEDGFATVPQDQNYSDKFNAVYKPLLDKNPAIEDQYKTKEYFLSHYQLMRNLVHMGDNKYIVFLYPKGNDIVRNQVEEAALSVVKNHWSHHIIPMVMEDSLDELCKLDSGKVRDYYINEFGKKYRC